MKILITGASGFVGSFLVEHALAEGFDTWAAMRRTSSRQYLTDPRTQFIELDLGNDARLQDQLRQHVAEHGAFDCVIHAAGATKAPSEAAFRKVNAEGTERLARLLLQTGALVPQGRFVFVSSLSVMGNVCDAPQCDATGRPLEGFDRYRPFSEADVPAPNTDYGRSKLEAEELLARMPHLNYIVLRPTGVYGPRERDYFLMADSIRKHVDFAVGYTPQVITFIYVRDLVEACFLSLTRGERGKAYFLSDGCDYDSRRFSILLQEAMQVRGVLHIVAPEWVLHGVCAFNTWLSRHTHRLSTLNMDKFRILKQRNWRCDISSAQRDLGYNPQWGLERGVREAVEWYKANGWL